MQGGVLSKYLPFPRREAAARRGDEAGCVEVARVARHTGMRDDAAVNERDNRTPLSSGSR